MKLEPRTHSASATAQPLPARQSMITYLDRTTLRPLLTTWAKELAFPVWKVLGHRIFAIAYAVFEVPSG